MDSSDNMVNHTMEALALNDGAGPEGPSGQEDILPVDMLRYSFALTLYFVCSAGLYDEWHRSTRGSDSLSIHIEADDEMMIPFFFLVSSQIKTADVQPVL